MKTTANQSTYQKLHEENARLRAENEYLKQELSVLKRMIFGQSRERFVPNYQAGQLRFDLGAAPEESDVKAIEKVEYLRSKPKKQQTPHSRNPLPAHLPRKEIVVEPEEDTTGLKRIGEQVSEELEYKPGRLYVNRYIRPKYARGSDEGVIIGRLPERPIEKGIPGPGLLSHVLISKYVDHLPLHRLRQQFKREKVDIAPATISDWVRYSGELLEPLYEALVASALRTDYIMADETPLRVLDKNKKGKSHTGYFWVYYSPGSKEAFFDYRDNRSREGPRDILKDYTGYLQSDGYAGYNELARREGIIALACFAHARRKFEKALESDRPRAEWMLEEIGRLYEIERIARQGDYSHEDRRALRRQKAVPVLKTIKAWLNEQLPLALPKSQIGQAIAYTHNLWSRLEKYVEDGSLEIDNNLVENAIRPVALGRKNYLFAGSHKSAHRAAIIYSLVSTAKLHGVEPFEYLKDVLSRISSHPYKQIHELLPMNWQKSSDK